MKKRLHVAMCLDSSGSMLSIADAAKKGFNDQIKSLKERIDEDVEILVTTIVFSSQVEIHQRCVPVETVEYLDNYCPTGSTALYDAVGTAISVITGAIASRGGLANADDDKALVVTVTDGYENASREYSREAIVKVLNNMKATKRWDFLFLGTEDALDSVKDLGIESMGADNYYTLNTRGMGSVQASYACFNDGLSRSVANMVQTTSNTENN